MGQRILKYELPVASRFMLKLHRGTRLLKVDVINEKAYLWAVVLEDAPERDTYFRVVATGEQFDLPSTFEYVGTFILCYGEFVGHLWVDTGEPVQADREMEGTMKQ